MTTADDSRAEPVASGQPGERVDPAAVAALYLKYADDLRAFLMGVLRSGDLAGEALQATFVKTMEAGHTAREETLKGWLFRVAFNEAMLIRRRQRIEDKVVRKLAWSKTKETETPDESVIRWEIVEQIRTALDTLPKEQRQVVRMRIYDEMTFTAIAEKLGTPLGTVLTRMRLALQKLHRQIDSKER